MKGHLSRLIDSVEVGYACFTVKNDDTGFCIGGYLEGNSAFESLFDVNESLIESRSSAVAETHLIRVLLSSITDSISETYSRVNTSGLDSVFDKVKGKTSISPEKVVEWACWPLDRDTLAIEVHRVEDICSFDDISQTDIGKNIANDFSNLHFMFQEVFHQLPYGAVLYDKEGTIIDVNPLFELGVGSLKDNLRSMNMFERIVDQGILEAIEKSLEGRPGYYEGICHSLTGSSSLPVKGVFLGLHSKNGDIIGGVGVLENITTAVREEEATREIEVNFAQFLERSNDIFYRQAFQTGLFEYISPSLTRILGYDVKYFYESSHEDHFLLFHPDDRGPLFTFREDLLLADERQEILEREFRFRHLNGTYCWLLGRYTLLRDTGGDPIMIVGSLQEITQRKKIEEDLIQREALLKSLINNAPFDVWVRDINGKGIYENQKAIDHFGSIVGKYVVADESIPEETIRIWEANNRRILAGQVINEETKFIINNELRTYQQIAFPIMNGETAEGIAGFNIDVTDRVKYFSRVEKLNDCLLAFGNDTQSNVRELLRLCGETLNGAVVVFNRISINGEIAVAADWRLPERFIRSGILEETICSLAVNDVHGKPVEINDLQHSIYNKPESNIALFGYQTYLGVVVKIAGKTLGTVCLYYHENLTLPKQDSDFLVLISYAVGIEEDRLMREQSLKTTLERNRALLEAIPDDMYLFDREGFVLNRPGLKDFSLESYKDEAGKVYHLSSLFPNDVSDLFVRNIDSVLNSGVAVFSTLELPELPEAKTFETRFVKCGENEVLAMMRDISEQRKAEIVSKESESKYKLLADNARDVIWTMDLSGKYHYISPSVYQLRGITPEENMLETLDESLTPESATLAKNLLQEYYQIILSGVRPEPVLLRLEQFHKNGGVVWTEINITAIYDQNGSFRFFQGVTRDITERVKSERLLEESRTKMEAILKAIPDLLFIIDSKGTFIDVITEPANRLSLSIGNFAGKSLSEIFSQQFSEMVMGHVNRCIETHEVVNFSYSLNQNGVEYHYEARVVYVGGDTVLSIVRDVTREVEATGSLKESEERYKGLQELFRNMADNMMDMIWAKDVDGKFMFVNKAICERLLGASNVNEPIGKDDSAFPSMLIVDETDGASFADRCIRTDRIVLETGESMRFEEGQRLNGKELWLEVDKSPLRNTQGVVIGTVGAAREITERKLMEKKQRLHQRIGLAMAESESLTDFIHFVCHELSSFVDMTNFYVALYDADHGVFESSVFADQYDKTDRWLAANTFTELVIKRNAPVQLNQIEISGLIESGKINYSGEQLKSWFGIPLRKEGVPFGAFVLQNYQTDNAYADIDLELMLFVGNQIGVAVKRKEDEQQIKLLIKSIEQSSVSVVITDHHGAIEYVNPKFTEVAGYTLEEAVGQNPRILKSGNQPDHVYQELWSEISNGRQWSGELENKTKFGAIYWESVSISPVLNDKGEITHYVAIKEDVTEKKHMIEELIKAKELAQESDRLKSAFLANMSHEIRTPLNGILGFADLLGEGNLSNNEVVGYASIISKSGSRLLELINNIIDVSKIESGTVKVSLKPMVPYQLLDDVTNQFLIRAQRQGIELRISVAESHYDESILSDSVKLHQILTNLINNALKFTDHGYIETGFVFKGDDVEFFVKDTGRGIPKELQDKVFDRFYQVDTTYSRGFEGAGLGLSLCKGLVDLLHGRIWVESQIGEGSIFRFSIPLRRTSMVQNSVSNSFGSRSSLIGPKVLIAEDDDDSFNYLKILLKRWGFEVLRARSGVDVVRLVEEDRSIMVILMDIKMPQMDGLEATRLIRSFNKRVFIVAQTGFAVSGDREKCLNAGCNEYISKPVAKELLEEVLRPYMLS